MAVAGDISKFLESFLQTEPKFIELLCYVYLGFSLLTVCFLQFLSAPYGRYSRVNFGILIPVKVAWFVQELPAILVPAYLVSFTECPLTDRWRNRFALGFYCLHYFQRIFIYPFLIRGGKPTSLLAFVLAFCFCLVNGYLQGRHLLTYADLQYSVSQIQFFTGILLFITGMCINIHSDNVLRNLRKEGEEGYKIPFGGLFEYVSGANFLGEVIEWFGFALMCGTLPTLAFAVFTLSNIGPRACQHHRWYLQKFEDYPKHRKALIPFVL